MHCGQMPVLSDVRLCRCSLPDELKRKSGLGRQSAVLLKDASREATDRVENRLIGLVAETERDIRLGSLRSVSQAEVRAIGEMLLYLHGRIMLS